MIQKDDLKVNAVITTMVYGTARESTLQNRGTISFARNLWYSDADKPPRREGDTSELHFFKNQPVLECLVYETTQCDVRLQ